MEAKAVETSLTLDGTTSKTISEYVASGAGELTSITDLTITGGTITEADWNALGSFTGLKNFTVDAGVTVNNMPNGSLADSIFSSSIVSVTINSNSTFTVGEYAFYNCTALKSVSLPNATEIGIGAFFNCTALSALSLPASPPEGALEAVKDLNITITLVDENGVALTGTAYTTAMAAYKEGGFEEDFTFAATSIPAATPLPVTPTTTEDTTQSSEVVVPIIPQWVPTTPEDIRRFALMGTERTVLASTSLEGSQLSVVPDVQGPLCIAVMDSVAGEEYTLARTYNFLVNNECVYELGEQVEIKTMIPESLQETDRTFRMICVSENGLPYVFEDLDNDPTTITILTDKSYAYGLIYKD